MPTNSYEFRVCISCGLRYPLVEGNSFGTRCPVCLGETRLLLSRALHREPSHLIRETHGGRKTVAVLLDNIRSAWNVGSILRSADGFGFTHAYLCGITPTGDHEAVTKTSLGAEDSVSWSYHKDAVKLVKGLKHEDWNVYALEESSRAITINAASTTAPRTALGAAAQREVLIVGNEVTGVDPELLELCDQIFYIPMRGAKRSLNVAIAFSIAAYALSIQDVKS